jgi:hypothetical protein
VKETDSKIAQKDIRSTSQVQVKQQQLLQRKGDIPRPYPDPAVTGIDFRIISRSDQYHGRVSITATVQNIGNVPYMSKENQQAVQLYERVPGSASSPSDLKLDYQVF